ncbi:formyl transferase [Limnofasciculus baicalensis]|uniref:phosphoribosylglycinamide formyltransferase 1 n=1 Tax=Limnofasciculus baicalensis BBK-W-15 TaxID=2699891 RepID=A0AAE3KNL4_9CYAN|nr:formyl transferase [Limnofasciculus baicalensis]MCP2729961.1 formyl transferase [Limnofasciculus baicalensis BBK-W-15]
MIRKTKNSYTTVNTCGDRLRILALCSDDPQHHYLISELAARFDLVGAIIEPGKDQYKRLWQKARYTDWLFRYWHINRQKFTGRSRYRWDYFSPLIRNTGQINNIYVDWIGSQETVEAIRDFKPDLTVVCGTMYIPKQVIHAADFMINVHGGYLPDYRGNHCIFFAYYNADYAKIAATLHVVSPQLDGGEIIEIVKPPIYPHDNDEHLYCRGLHLAMLRLFDLIEGFEAGRRSIQCYPQIGEGTMYRHSSRKPHHDFLLWLRKSLGLQQVPHIPVQNFERFSLPQQVVEESLSCE